jgi:Na+/H+-dicarboxylate symporter
VIATQLGWQNFTLNWIAPWGTIFINLLKVIAVPLVFTSLICGVTSLSDIQKLTAMGSKTIGIYILTTAVAVTIGLGVANIFNPGKGISPELKSKLQQSYTKQIKQRQEGAKQVKERRPLAPLVEMVPSNIFAASANNRKMLQVVFMAILLGISLIKVGSKAAPVIAVLEGLNEMVLRMVDIIMGIAPLGVFSLLATMIVKVAGDSPTQLLELLQALGGYSLVVVLGLALHTFIVYPLLIKFFTRFTIKKFFKAILPAQLLAFSTSSSGATLPVTMECCEENLGISEEVSSFVLPLGATINMDGTALYQAVATLFIAQATGMSLGFGAQITIVFTAVLASIGTAAVPGAGIIMLVIILESVGVPSSGIALILGVDRILDMIRTTTNVTGDATVAAIVFEKS